MDKEVCGGARLPWKAQVSLGAAGLCAGAVTDTPPFPFQWLNEEKTIQRLVELIHPSQDEDVSRGSQSHLGVGARLRAAAGFRPHCLRVGHSSSDAD